MQSQLYSISKIFSEKLFRIPDYQRGYAWTSRQLKDFWNDIIQLELPKNHYCGVITLEPANKGNYNQWKDDIWIIESKSYEPYFVVDGQQRLTTTIILLQAILERIPEGEKLNFTSLDKIREKFIFETKDNGISRSYIFGYEIDNPSYEFLKTEIFLENSSSSYTSEETIYTHNLSKAKEFFSDQLKPLNHDDVEVIYKKLTQHLLFNIYTITNDIDVFVAFETMNNRGKPLSNLELLKNRIIYLTTKMDMDNHEKTAIRTIINDSWRAVYHYLGKNKLVPLHDDIFLQNHFEVYIYDSDIEEEMIKEDKYYTSDMYSHYLFNKKFTSKRLYDNENILTINEIKSYADSLKQSVITWYNLHFPKESSYTKDEKTILEKISRLKDEDSLPLLLAIYNTKKQKKESRIVLLNLIEKNLFLRTLVYYYDTDLNVKFVLLAVDFIKGKTTLDKINSNLTQSINSYITSEKFVIDIKRRFNESNFYNWRSIRYFLFEYEQFLHRMTKNKTAKVLWSEFDIDQEDYVTVEHIYPQRPISDYWKVRFEDCGVREKRKFQNSLGNLLALSKPKNSSLQNKPFLEKLKGANNYIGYKYGSYSEIEVSENIEWGQTEILNRGMALLSFMEKNWQVKLGTNNDKVRILGLDFRFEYTESK